MERRSAAAFVGPLTFLALTTLFALPTPCGELRSVHPATSVFALSLLGSFSCICWGALQDSSSLPSITGSASLSPVVALFALSLFTGAARAAPWSADVCATPVAVGSSSGGNPFTILGEAGSTVSKVRFYRNNGQVGYLRGLVVFFSDGLQMRAGVRKDQFSDLIFGDGELVTSMTLWKIGWPGNSTVRVARIDVSTDSQTWGYGVDNTGQLSATAVDVASGVLVGFQGRAGDDLDQLAAIFLKKTSSSTVDNIVFERFGPQDGLTLVTLREGTATWNGTDYSWTFSGSETREASTTFTTGSSNSINMGTTFRAAVPFLESGISAGWTGGATESHESHSNNEANLGWSVTISLSSTNPGVSCVARVWEGRLNVGWTGIQTIVVDGRVWSYPVSGIMTRVAYGKVDTDCRPLFSSSLPADNVWDGFWET